MVDEVRIALLARPGPAREQLRKSLTELGAVVVAEGDPAELDPSTVGQLGPTVVVVSLEPAIESALERFDDLLATDGVEVMYDDAEVTGKLEGWDLARWARHLASKLMGRDLQPPPPEDAVAEPEMHPKPGLPPTPAQLMDGAKLEDYTAESPELAEWVPTNPSLTGDAPAVDDDAAPRAQESDELPDFDLDMSSIESAMAGLPDVEMPAAPAPAAAADELSFDGDFSLELGGLEDFILKDEAPPAAKPATKEEPLLADFEFDSGSINFADFAPRDDVHESVSGMDADVAALAAQLEEFEKADTRETARDPDFSWAPNDDAAKAPEMRATPPRTSAPIADVPEPPKKSFEFGSLSLVDDDTIPVEPIKPKPVAAPTFDSPLNLSLEDLDDTAVKAKAIRDAAMAAKSKPAPATAPPKVNFDTGSLSLETVELEPRDSSGPDEYAAIESAPGAVLVVAGMGGPDAVRQFLSHLPHTLPVPVLLYQHLEVGKHERLVDQLAKVSRMPVYLAVAGEPAQPGKVAVLPAGMSADAVGDGLRFTPGALDALVREMPAADSVLVVLSGADPGLVPSATALRNGGGQAFAQTPDSCFDATAAQSLANAGASAMPAAQIAARVAARWPA